jgi:hypothetical protein
VEDRSPESTNTVKIQYSIVPLITPMIAVKKAFSALGIIG